MNAHPPARRLTSLAAVAALVAAITGLVAGLGPQSAGATTSCPASKPTAEGGINGTSVPITQIISQYAHSADPTLAAAIDTSVEPVTVAVAGAKVALVPLSGCPGVLQGQSASGLTATLRYNWMPDAKALTYTVDLTNGTSAAVTGVRVQPFALTLQASPASLTPCARYHGGVSSSWSQQSTAFTTTSVAPLDLNGASSATTTPILDIALNEKPAAPCTDTAAAQLAGFYVGFAWAGRWQFHAGWNSSGNGFTVVADTPNQVPTGNAFPDSTFSVPANSTLSYPTVELGFFNGPNWQSLDRAQVAFVAKKLRPTHDPRSTYPVTYDSYFGLEGADNEALLREEARTAASIGVEAFTIDAGWYSAFNTILPLGNWFTPDHTKYPLGAAQLSSLCDYVRSLGMRCGLWTLYQESDAASDGYAKTTSSGPLPLCPNVAKPALANVNTVWSTDTPGVGGAHVMQMQNSDAVAWAEYQAACDVEAFHLGYFRFETISPGGGYEPDSGPYDSVAAGQNITKVLDDMRARYPQVDFEASEAGGGRMNFGTLARSEQNWLKDGVYEPSKSAPAQLAALRVWPANYDALSDITCLPGKGTAGCSPTVSASAYAVMSRMAGRLTFDGDLAAWTPAQLAQVRTLNAAYKQFRGLMDQPAYFPLPLPATTAPLANWDAVVFGSSADGSADQLMYTYRGPASSSTASSTLAAPSGPGSGWRLVMTSGGAPTASTNADGSVTVSQDPSSVAIWRRNLAPAVPAAPSDLMAAQNQASVTLAWQNNAAGSMTRLDRSTDNGATWSTIGVADASATTYVDADVAVGGHYSYRAVAVSNDGAASTAAPTASVDIGSSSSPIVVDDISHRIAYSGGFQLYGSETRTPLSQGFTTVHSTNAAGSTATFSCPSCTRIVWQGRNGPDLGQASVQVDNGAVVSKDLYAPSWVQAQPFDSGPLPSGPHTLTITVTGTKNAQASGAYVEVDAVNVTEQVANVALVDDTAPGITYSGGEQSFAGFPGLFGTTAHSTSSAGGFSYTCTSCTQLAWWSHTRPGFATASVSIDGQPVSVDTGTAAQPSHAVFVSPLLSRGQHTISVTKTGPNGTWMELDALQVTP